MQRCNVRTRSPPAYFVFRSGIGSFTGPSFPSRLGSNRKRVRRPLRRKYRPFEVPTNGVLFWRSIVSGMSSLANGETQEGISPAAKAESEPSDLRVHSLCPSLESRLLGKTSLAFLQISVRVLLDWEASVRRKVRHPRRKKFAWPLEKCRERRAPSLTIEMPHQGTRERREKSAAVDRGRSLARDSDPGLRLGL